VAFNERNGEILWAYFFENQDTPAVVGTDAIYLVGQDGEVIALDTDGQELWTYQTGYPMHRGFAGLNECGMLQFGTDDGHYMAFATESTGLDPTSDCPTYRCNYHRTGTMF
jgi:outer membrane protein assembly factor BamB